MSGKRIPRRVALVASMLSAALIAFVVLVSHPIIRSADAAQQLRVMSNLRQLLLAAQQMALDGVAASDPDLQWPGDYGTAVQTLEQYCTKLVDGGYFKPNELERVLSGPKARISAAYVEAPGANKKVIRLHGKSAVKIYTVQKEDGSNTIFAVSANYTYNTQLDRGSVPYGDSGFVVVRKGGDAAKSNRSKRSLPVMCAVFRA